MRLSGSRTWVVALGVVIAIGACDGGGASSPTAAPTTAVVSTGPATTTATSLATSTVPVSSTVAPSTSPATTAAATAAPPPTTDPIEALLTVEAVTAAAHDADNTFIECVAALPNCNTGTFARTHTGDQLAQAQSQLHEMNSEGIHARNTEAHMHVVMSVDFEYMDSADGNTATTTECTYDDSVLFTVFGAAETIVDDQPVASIRTRRYVIEDGRWKREDSELVREVQSCDG